jgi:nucleotide-binding universal stress UspA family protein
MVKDKPKGDYKNIIAGCDFSNSSKESFYLSLEISKNATINLIHACTFSDTSRGHKIEAYAGDIFESIEAEQLEKFVQASAKTLKKFKIPTKKLIYKTIKGSPQDILTNEVKKSKADLLAIGVHSRAGFINSKLGGVAEDILANPPCDILIAQGI